MSYTLPPDSWGKQCSNFRGRVEERPFSSNGVLYVLGVQKFLATTWRESERLLQIIGICQSSIRQSWVLSTLPGNEAREIVEQDRAALLPRFLAAEQQTKDRFPHAI
jgi:hypothetical protein